MNTLWSEYIQGPMTLYLSRKLRFHDWFQARYRDQLEIGGQARILEIGCGPGALAGALHRWYPDAEITGIDRDSRFIAFAREHEPGVKFVEGDAAALPFSDQSFDVTISYTVQEHIAPDIFWGEQRRVLKPGGVCICMSARRNSGFVRKARCLETSEEETVFWNSVPNGNNIPGELTVGKYWLDEAGLPMQMQEYGFRDISTGFVLIGLTPDNPGNPAGFAVQMIEAERQADIEAVLSAHTDNCDHVIQAINNKYDIRLKLLEEGKKQWDTSVTVTMIVRGRK